MRKTKVIKWLVGLLTVTFVFAGCGDSDDDSKSGKQSTDNGNEAWLTRQATPAAEFVPAGIEGVLDNLVAALNATNEQSGMKLAVVPKDASPFFQIAMLGSNRAIAELGVLGSVTAADEYDDGDEAAAAQIALTQPFIDQGYHGLAIAPITDALSEVIDAAVAAGMPVVTFDGDNVDSNRQFYLGTDNSAAGKTSGETLAGLIEETSGTVIVYGHTEPAWAGGYNRTMGAANVLEAAGYTVLHQVINWVDKEADAATMAEVITNADPPVVGMIGMFSNAFVCADGAVASGLIDNIKIVAFDFEAPTLQYLQDGQIQATHVQRQYYMGYLAPYILYAGSVLGIEATKALLAPLNVGPGLYDTGLDVIMGDKVASYNAFLDSLGILD